MRRAAIFDYKSIFARDILRAIEMYNSLDPKEPLSDNIFSAEKYHRESLAGPTDIIIHSGGNGRPVIEDVENIPRLYICYSHQWKAKIEGGKVIRLNEHITGMQSIDILEDDTIFGRKGKMPIMQYHELAVVAPPPSAKVIATSKARDLKGKEIETIVALRYSNGSVSIQGHPEEGTAFHIFYNFFEKIQKNGGQMRS